MGALPSAALLRASDMRARIPREMSNCYCLPGKAGGSPQDFRSVLTRLKTGKLGGASFNDAIQEASRALEETERRGLAEYVVRRKVVLDFLELLIQKVRADTSDSAYQREDVLHSF